MESQNNSKLNKIKTVFKNTIAPLVSFYTMLSIVIAMLVISVVSYINYKDELDKSALKTGHIVAVNIYTDEIIKGNVYNEKETHTEIEDLPEEKKEQPNETTDEVSENKEQQEPEAKEEHPTEDTDSKTNTVSSKENTSDEHPKEQVETLTNYTENHLFRAQIEPNSLKDKAKISIIFVGLGLNKNMTDKVMSLSNSITLGFTPYAHDLKELTKKAHTKGFESILQLPMQPIDYLLNDPGSYAMLNNLSVSENVNRLHKMFHLSSEIVGFYTTGAETFSPSLSNMSPIMKEISEGGYYFVYGNSQSQKQTRDICSSMALECMFLTQSIENELNADNIYKKLLMLESHAANNQYAIGYLNTNPVSIQAFQKWYAELNSKKFILVPVSAILSEMHTNENK